MIQTDKIQQQKFELLFREYFKGLCYFAQKYLGDLDTSKEVVHSVFIKIWENRDSFDWEKPAKSYLFTSVYNRSINYIRDNKKFMSQGVENELNNIPEQGDYNDNLEMAELEGKVKLAISKLPEKCREVFEMSRFEGKKYSEIAKTLNISVKTVETQMSKALKVMKEELKDYLYLFLILMLNNIDKL